MNLTTKENLTTYKGSKKGRTFKYLAKRPKSKRRTDVGDITVKVRGGSGGIKFRTHVRRLRISDISHIQKGMFNKIQRME
jgi:hypothetical protein